MIKALFTKWFNAAIKPFADRIQALEDARPEMGYDAPTETNTLAIDGLSQTKTTRKPLITKSDATKNLKEYEDGYKTAMRSAPAGQQVGSEIEFYEKNNKELKRETLRGAAAIDGFIARAKKDEVRLVRQVR